MNLGKTAVLAILVGAIVLLGVGPARGSGEGPIHTNDTHIEVPLLNWLIHLQQAPITKATLYLFVVTGLIIAVFAYARRRGDQEVPSGLYNMLEAMVVFVRDDIAINNMGAEHGRRWTPFLLTVFVFIYTGNMVGLVPGSYTITSNINVTGAMALVTLAMMQFGGIREYGFLQHLRNLVPPGIPVVLLPVMVVVEVMGVLAKPFALCVRLFANMTAGHVVIASLLLLIGRMGLGFAPVSVGFALFIFCLELLVALLQAYIFTMLTALFVGMSVHVSH